MIKQGHVERKATIPPFFSPILHVFVLQFVLVLIIFCRTVNGGISGLYHYFVCNIFFFQLVFTQMLGRQQQQQQHSYHIHPCHHLHPYLH